MNAQMKRYNRLKADGLCVDCGGELDRQGVRCVSCLEKKREEARKSREMYRKMGVCPICRQNRIVGSESNCPECLAKAAAYRASNKKEIDRTAYNAHMRNYNKQRYKEKKESGMCVRCGKRKAEYGFFRCKICREKDREKHRLKSNKIPRNERYLYNLCFFCDNPPMEGYKTCEEHYKMCVRNATCDNAKKAREKLRKEGRLW